MISSGEEFLTVAELATIFKVDQKTVRNWIDRGELPAVRVGARRVRIGRSDFEQFLEQGRTQTAQPEQSPTQEFREGERRPRHSSRSSTSNKRRRGECGGGLGGRSTNEAHIASPARPGSPCRSGCTAI